MEKFHVKKGDEVVVISGSSRGKRGKIIRVLRGDHRVVVEGVQMIKRHMRQTRDNPQGQIIRREGTIHLSNVMKADRYDARRGKAAAGSTT